MRRPPRLPEADVTAWMARVWAGNDAGRVRSARPLPARPVASVSPARVAAGGLPLLLVEVRTTGLGQGTADVGWPSWPLPAAWWGEAGEDRAWPSVVHGARLDPEDPDDLVVQVDDAALSLPQCSGGVLAWTLDDPDDQGSPVVGATVWVAVAADTETDWYSGAIRHQLWVTG